MVYGYRAGWGRSPLWPTLSARYQGLTCFCMQHDFNLQIHEKSNDGSAGVHKGRWCCEASFASIVLVFGVWGCTLPYKLSASEIDDVAAWSVLKRCW